MLNENYKNTKSRNIKPRNTKSRNIKPRSIKPRSIKTKKNIKNKLKNLNNKSLKNINNKSLKTNNEIINNFDWKTYFPYEKNLDYKNLQITTIGLYSISKPYLSKLFINLIKKLIPKYKEKIITDANGGIGGDAILFTKLFKFVNIVEIDKLHTKVINNNLKCYNRNNYIVYNSNVLDLLKNNKINQDIIYFDPPWGGPDYKKYELLELYLDDIPFSKIVKEYIQNYTIICKLPINYNINLLKEITKKYKKKIYIKKIGNILLIFINF